jgi:PhzF family phenazine biosynthesis protein
MPEYAFRLVNVFTVGDAPFTGNPLCVFEQAEGLSEVQMQALARQFNLSETTFVLRATPGRTARVRIFTPSFEMPFAGHPTLGTAHVVRAHTGCGDRLVLEMGIGPVEVTARGNEWTLRADGTPAVRACDAPQRALAAMLSLPESDVGDPPLWVDTGAEQLVIPLVDADAVERARPRPELFESLAFSPRRAAAMAYVWAPESPGWIRSRFFFSNLGAVSEDPATGSACANLGGWMIATGQPLPARVGIHQGSAVGRPSELGLHIDARKSIYVTGRVAAVGSGTVALPA